MAWTETPSGDVYWEPDPIGSYDPQPDGSIPGMDPYVPEPPPVTAPPGVGTPDPTADNPGGFEFQQQDPDVWRYLTEGLKLTWPQIQKLIAGVGGVATLIAGIRQGSITAGQIQASVGAQQQSNLQTAQQTSVLNNPNVITPQGQQITTFDPKTGQPTITQTLSPEQQQLYTGSVQNQITGNSIAAQSLQGLQGSMAQPYGLAGAPDRVDLSQFGPIQGSVNLDSGSIQRGVDFGAAGQIVRDPGQFGQIQGSLDYSGAPAMPVANENVRNQVTQSVYDQAVRFLDDQFRNRQNDLETMLANQGIPRGSEAWNREMEALNNARDESYNDLMMRSVVQGGNSMEQLFGMEMGARQQGVGEVNTQGQFANTAQNQGAQQMLARQAAMNTAQNQGANQILAAGQFGNQAQGQFAGQQLQAGQFANTAQNQGVGQYLAGTAANNQARGQEYQEYVGNRAGPLNEYLAFSGRGQFQSPAFPSGGQATVAPTNVQTPAYLAASANNSTLGNVGQFLTRGASTWGN